MKTYEYTINTPLYSNWRVQIVPGTYLTVLEGKKIPNRFQRWMQGWVFGFKWECVGK